MAKRFIDSDLLEKDFFSEINNDMRMLYIYAITKCNHAGILSFNKKVVKAYLGYEVKDDELLKFNTANKERFVKLKGNKWFIPDFIDFQYGELKNTNNAHKSVIKILNQNSIIVNDDGSLVHQRTLELDEPVEGLVRGSPAPLDKDKDKDQDKVKEKAKVKVKEKDLAPKTNLTRDFVAVYCENFKLRWGTNPVIGGKQSGIARRISQEMTLDRFKILIKAYFEMPDSWLQKTKHPLEGFERKLNEIVVWSERGDFTTMRQVRENDSFSTTAQLLAKIDRGEL